jgi:hypothetical protein
MSQRSLHDALRDAEPRTAPEPETAEQRMRRLARRGALPVAIAGAAVLAKWIVTTAGFHAVLHPGWWSVGLALVLFAAGLYVVGAGEDEDA